MNLQDEIKTLKNTPNSDHNKINEEQFQLDTENIKYKQIRKGLSSDGSILSDMDGKIVAINSSVNHSSDSTASASSSLFEIVSTKPNFVVNWTLSSTDAKKFSVDDKVNIIKASDNSNSTNIELSGQVLQKQYNTQTSEYEFSASIDGTYNFKENDNVTVGTIENAKTYDNVIPKSCLNEENGLDYIFIVNQKGGALGTYEYVQKVQVQVVASNDENCSIKSESGASIPSNYGIVMSTSKTIDDNSEVKINTDSE